ncbi:MAG: DUF4336 domain-containing protein [Deltaproteobacteria bacterium]|nr:DUF4336 domain-containing protein [Deltaproteobacteria bacterium]MBT4266924.1 DUF4336 domain-containing protein [Deltaproteobacteria bacterium]MBT4642969.1 DUF4336 domain-containing protein [Deltaproteobacteria bacterium]MBT6615081.1 DUF4336 domain-containing protein [Deltaproteobacteria bacterium]
MNLKEFGENIWTLEGNPVKVFSIPFQTRMTIVRLSDSALWLHSPIAGQTESRTVLIQQWPPAKPGLALQMMENKI